MRRVDADWYGASVWTREHETVDHLTHTQGFPLVGRLNELGRVLPQKEPCLVLHTEINDVAVILNALNTTTKQLGIHKKRTKTFTQHTHHITAMFLIYNHAGLFELISKNFLKGVGGVGGGGGEINPKAYNIIL